MSDRQERHEEWAIFWCSLLAPLLYGEIAPSEVGGFLRELADQEHLFPDGRRRKVSRATLWRKWKEYQQGGWQALVRKRRNDRGRPRGNRGAMIQKAIALKKDQPYRSDETINQFLQEQFHARLPKATLYRHLRRVGATRLKLGVAQGKVRCRWTRDQSNALWVGDFENGPYVMSEDRAVGTHLSAFIDCHSRYVVEARYYLRENLDILVDSLLRAWSIHGASRELYVDNGKIYHAHALRRACLALNIRLLHRAVGDPPPGGLVERFFETVQTQLEAEVRAGEILTLERLNRALAAWLAVSYHERPHSETGQPPGQRYQQGRPFVRHVDTQEVLVHFLERDRRTVHREFSDVQLQGAFFRVDSKFRGDKVEVRYDPFAELESVLIYSLQGEYLGIGRRHTRQPQSEASSVIPPPAKPQYNYLDLLVAKHEASLRDRSAGIDYPAAMARAGRRWPFVEFVKQLAAHLGRSGGLSAFRTDELETLQKVYERLVTLDASLLRGACERATSRSIPDIVFLLQQLSDERSR